MRVGFVALFGPANAGKSTLLNRVLGQKVSIVSNKPQTTRNQVLGVKTIEKGQIVFLDTPGIASKKYKGKLSRQLEVAREGALKDVDISVLVLDAHSLQNGASGVISLLSQEAPVEILILNKVDLLKKGVTLHLMSELSRAFSEAGLDVPELFPVSAKSGEGIDECLAAMLARLPEGPLLYPKDVSSDADQDWFVSEIIREKLYRQLNQELPYSVAVRIESLEEEKKLTRIAALILVERPSQKGMVIGERGSKLKSIGKAARLDLERLLGQKVFLELHVKVEPNWISSEQSYGT